MKQRLRFSYLPKYIHLVSVRIGIYLTQVWLVPEPVLFVLLCRRSWDIEVAREREERQSKGNKEDGAIFSDSFALRAVGSKGGRRRPKWGQWTADPERGSQHGLAFHGGDFCPESLPKAFVVGSLYVVLYHWLKILGSREVFSMNVKAAKI